VSTTLCLGKNGDILSVLPCLQAEFKETGVKPTIIVAKAYANLVRPLDWLYVEEFDGDFEFVGNALRWAKQRGKIDFMPMMSGGPGYPAPKRLHHSFQYDQWDRMGRLHQWKELTLELPRMPLADALMPRYKPDTGPFILLADHSQSSPFEPIEDLYDSLIKEFPSRSIVRCSSIRTPHLFDFLTLMDAADLIVTIDTAFLHLSRACKTPVIALVTDKPGTWWGSAWHPRFAMHCRYADYALRKSELLWTAKRVVK
jgi:hypothetical protein